MAEGSFTPLQAQANQVAEWSFTSTGNRKDPFNEVELDAVFTTPAGRTLRVPAFWAGGQTWRLRYASDQIGLHTFRLECSDQRDRSLHGLTGGVEIKPYAGENIFFRHGPVRIAADHRHFEQADGTPFLWLGEGWYFGLCERLKWPDEFQTLTADRAAKGFNVIQIVAGLQSDIPPFDERGRNEGGFPWERDYTRINPAYFDAADRRIQYLVDAGCAPCLFGSWGFYATMMGEARLKKHWRYLVARYGAYPIFWCLAGESSMPYYLSSRPEADKEKQRKVWTAVARYVRQIDPWHRPLSIHPPVGAGRDELLDPLLVDFKMLQTGHTDKKCIPDTSTFMHESLADTPTLPVLDAEVCYEGIMGGCAGDLQHFLIWKCLLSGAAGHSYGANGIWQADHREKPFGESVNGHAWGDTPWDQAMHLPGSTAAGLAKRVLERYPWWKFEAHDDWFRYDYTEKNPLGHWVWTPEGSPGRTAPAGRRYFRRAFDLPAGETVTKAVLRVAADDNAVFFVNRNGVGGHVGWRPYKEIEVTSALKPGRNVIAAIGEKKAAADSYPEPAGLLCGLEIQLAGGGTREVVSDEGWRCSRRVGTNWYLEDFDDRDWQAVAILGKPGEKPWSTVYNPNLQRPPAAAGLPGHTRIIYIPAPLAAHVNQLEPGIRYRATFIHPQTGAETPAGVAEGDAANSWPVPPRPPESRDWLLVLDAI